MPPFAQEAQDVTTAEAARIAAGHIERAPAFAVDVEADAMHAFHARLCFVQVGTDEHVFLFDTLIEGVRAEVLASSFADPSRIKFFHAAGGDLQYLSEAGVRVKGLFDTHRAATLLGWPKVGLADLALERLGVTLPKEHQQSDFSLRPTPPGMREYIANDVRYLCEIGRQVREECRKTDILEEVELDCQRMADEAMDRPDQLDFEPKLPKGGSAQSRVLAQAIARELHPKRLKWAEADNVPMGRMLSNAALASIATQPPGNEHELRRLQGVRGPFVREHGAEVLEVVLRLSALSKEGKLEAPANDRAARDPKRKKREEALRAFRAEAAVSRKVTPSAVLPNPLVDELSNNPPPGLEALSQVPYFGEKRVRLYGAVLIELLAKV
ncbi:MAG: ribonuclease D [Myxococcaceae bacterium]